MGPRSAVAGVPDVSVVIRVAVASSGAPATGLVATNFALSYRREGAIAQSITLSNLTGLNDAHTDGGIFEIGAGQYRLDVPDAAFAAGSPGVLIFGTSSGNIVYGPYVELLDPVQGLFQSEAIGSVGNTTTTLHVPGWTFGDDEINDDLVGIYDISAAEWHFRLIQDWVSSSKLMTVATLPFTPQSNTDLVVRLGNLSLTDIRTEVDGAVSGLATSSALSGVGSNVSAVKAVTDRQDKAILNGSCSAAGTSTQVATSLTGYGDDAFIGRVITFDKDAAGTPGYQSYVTDYISSTGTFVWQDAAPGTPQSGDNFTIS